MDAKEGEDKKLEFNLDIIFNFIEVHDNNQYADLFDDTFTSDENRNRNGKRDEKVYRNKGSHDYLELKSLVLTRINSDKGKNKILKAIYRRINKNIDNYHV